MERDRKNEGNKDQRFVCDILTCTCGGVPRTYSTAFAISSGSREGMFLKASNIFFGVLEASAIPVLTVPGLILCKV